MIAFYSADAIFSPRFQLPDESMVVIGTGNTREYNERTDVLCRDYVLHCPVLLRNDYNFQRNIWFELLWNWLVVNILTSPVSKGLITHIINKKTIKQKKYMHVCVPFFFVYVFCK